VCNQGYKTKTKLISPTKCPARNTEPNQGLVYIYTHIYTVYTVLFNLLKKEAHFDPKLYLTTQKAPSRNAKSKPELNAPSLISTCKKTNNHKIPPHPSYSF
jgi:hypothetical protein